MYSRVTSIVTLVSERLVLSHHIRAVDLAVPCGGHHTTRTGIFRLVTREGPAKGQNETECVIVEETRKSQRGHGLEGERIKECL